MKNNKIHHLLSTGNLEKYHTDIAPLKLIILSLALKGAICTKMQMVLKTKSKVSIPSAFIRQNFHSVLSPEAVELDQAFLLFEVISQQQLLLFTR